MRAISAIAVDSSPAVVWVAMSSSRRGYRSASTPPYRPKASVGANCMATVTPTAVGLCERLRTNQSWATRWTQPPVLARSCEPAKSR